ncbi:zinc finger CCCH domain-containing protein 40-like isoform X1 [Cucurbita moschata]|uniref:Zinc finger CCCH domain-containing protein 40-like isoform X1 n=1 Tax=Cucurbita moschata TaxID=3662 RepID=A0A6J1EWA4_CUCMO|nr:zinc finger CCCH domain-containing protein 40-like isoform X1 [Cucurbita moschata]
MKVIQRVLSQAWIFLYIFIISMALLELAWRHYYCSLFCFSSFPCNGRREYRGNDLRHKLDSRHSPLQERDSRGRHGPRDYSSSWSLERQSDRKRRKKEYGDSRNDYSGNLRISDRSEERDREGKISSASRDTLEGQLNKMQADIEMAEHHKHQAEVYLDERIQEVDSLTSRIQELESQLYKEREDSRRIKSKIKKFVKAHNRYSRIQDELKRSQVRLQQLGDQLGSDVNKIGANEEDSSINIVSDGEDPGFHAVSPLHDLQKDNSASKKKHIVQDIAGNSKRADLNKGSKEAVGRLRRFSRWNAHPSQSVYSKIEAVGNEVNDLIPTANESKQKRGRTSTTVSSADKVRGLESGVVVPLTSMAAHAVDEEVDIELEINSKVNETRENTKEASFGSLPFPPPPPPIREINHSKYESEDQNVDVVALDDERARLDNA